jgi:hypothetical protein
VPGGGERRHITTGLGDHDLGCGTPNPGDRVEVGDVLLPLGVRHDCGDPGIQGHEQAGQMVDLIEIVATHVGVVLGEGSIQGSDQLRDLAAGAAHGQISQHHGVTFPLDQRLQDPARADPGQRRQDTGQFHTGVLQLLFQPLDLPAAFTGDLGASPGDIPQLPDHPRWNERGHHHA